MTINYTEDFNYSIPTKFFDKKLNTWIEINRSNDFIEYNNNSSLIRLYCRYEDYPLEILTINIDTNNLFNIFLDQSELIDVICRQIQRELYNKVGKTKFIKHKINHLLQQT